jgi:hypothetical protein
MQIPENLSLFILLLLAGLCILGALIPVELEISDIEEEDELLYPEIETGHLRENQTEIKANRGAATTSVA